jgi:hypothetical protein
MTSLRTHQEWIHPIREIAEAIALLLIHETGKIDQYAGMASERRPFVS